MELAEFTTRCDTILGELRAVSDEGMHERIDAARSRLRAERLKILVVGEFSRGKSTFINALVGLPVLPSKVNPTTATINVLTGGHPARAEVQYVDGRVESLALPDAGVNKFLDRLVTTANEQAQSIRVVNIQVPGRLESIQADLVDTPGVNDLDQAREETTFGYLRQADAAVMLLDAQQPISESERSFLKDKVIGSDVRRILFVVNKIDEVDSDANASRIVEYVRARLKEFLGVQDAVVHAVSAKDALRARFRKEADPERFRAFEQCLLAFAGSHAAAGRLGVHLERLNAILRDQHELIEARARAFGNDIAEVERELQALAESERALLERESRLDARLGDVGRTISSGVGGYCRDEVAAFRVEMSAGLKACTTDDHVEEFRQTLSGALRDLAARIEAKAAAAGALARREVEQDFRELLSEGVGLRRFAGGSAAALYQQSRSAATTSIARPDGEQKPDLSDAAVGFGLGWVGASLFGPIGIAAAVVGTYVIGKSRREQQAAELARLEREHMIAALDASCDQLAERAKATGHEVAQRIAAQLGEEIRERVATQLSLVSASREGVRAARSQSREERMVLSEAARSALASISELSVAARRLMEDCRHATA